MVKVFLKSTEHEDVEFLELTEDQFRLLELLKENCWLEEFVSFRVLEEKPFKRV